MAGRKNAYMLTFQTKVFVFLPPRSSFNVSPETQTQSCKRESLLSLKLQHSILHEVLFFTAMLPVFDFGHTLDTHIEA